MTSCKPPPTCIDASPIPDANDSRMSAIPYEANLTPMGETPLRDSPSVPDDQGNEAVAVAGGRPGWGCARRLGPEPARQAGRQTPAAQAAEKAVPGPSCHDHGQAGELRRREGGGDAFGRALEAQRFKQQSGELAPADTTARAADEALQV